MFERYTLRVWFPTFL